MTSSLLAIHTSTVVQPAVKGVARWGAGKRAGTLLWVSVKLEFCNDKAFNGYIWPVRSSTSTGHIT